MTFDSATPAPHPAGQSRRPLDFLWFLPTSGDGHYLGAPAGNRASTNRYLRELAQAVDRLGYHGVLLPTGRGCEDAWTTAASIVTHTEQLRFLVALRPGATLPAEAARQAAAFDRLSGGRLLLNIVCGGNPADLAGDGMFLGHDERYAQASEFLQVFRALAAGETVDFAGKYFTNTRGKLLFPPIHGAVPLWFGGSSEPAMQLAAEQLDTYLTWGEPPAMVAEKVTAVRRRAAAAGRSVRFGIRLHFIVRETDAEAWAAADRLIGHMSDETVAAAQAKLARESDSVGQARMTALHGGGRANLEVSPNLWAGVGLVRGGAGTALVGSPQTVAARLEEYRALGIDAVIGSGYPHLEEAYRVAELLFPLLDLSSHSPDRMLPTGQAPGVFAGGGALSLNAADVMGGTLRATA